VISGFLSCWHSTLRRGVVTGGPRSLCSLGVIAVEGLLESNHIDGGLVSIVSPCLRSTSESAILRNRVERRDGLLSSNQGLEGPKVVNLANVSVRLGKGVSSSGHQTVDGGVSICLRGLC